MDLVFGFSWRAWIFSGLLGAAWLLLWLAPSGRLRLWFAGLSPVAAVAGALFGLWAVGAVHRSHSGGGPVVDEGLGLAINSAFAFVVSMPLLFITLVVETYRSTRTSK